MDVTELFENKLVQTRKNEVLKVSTIYSPTRVTAQVVYPIPGRTTVRTCTAQEVEGWREPTDAIMAKYEIAWGYR